MKARKTERQTCWMINAFGNLVIDDWHETKKGCIAKFNTRALPHNKYEFWTRDEVRAVKVKLEEVK